jgi:hypothetical protein
MYFSLAAFPCRHFADKAKALHTTTASQTKAQATQEQEGHAARAEV